MKFKRSRVADSRNWANNSRAKSGLMKFTRRACNFASANLNHKSSPPKVRHEQPLGLQRCNIRGSKKLFCLFHVNGFKKKRYGFPLPSHSPFSLLYFAFDSIFVQQNLQNLRKRLLHKLQRLTCVLLLRKKIYPNQSYGNKR